MTDIQMPQLADGMEQGTIITWLVEDGQPVAAGEELVEIETDKATMAFPAEAAGLLERIVEEGSTVAVGEVIARIGGPAPNAPAPASADGVAPRPAAAPPTTTPPTPATPATPTPTPTTPPTPPATPLARRIAAAHGVDLGDLDGSGPHGRVVKADVLAAAGLPIADRDAAVSAAGPPAVDAAAPTIGGRIVQPTRLQRIVATRMAAAKATVPHFQVQAEAEMDRALALRAQLKEIAAEAPAPSVNDLVVRACALALRAHPLVNGSFVDGAYELHDAIHVGVAVAADDGLLVATIRDADVKALGAIAAESRELAGRVRAGTATPADLTGATFTVSNLGMFGMTAITPVINPPQAAILGVGAARPTLARIEGEIVDRQMLTLTLSGDHRILNGADASRFLADVKALLETPLRLAL